MFQADPEAVGLAKDLDIQKDLTGMTVLECYFGGVAPLAHAER